MFLLLLSAITVTLLLTLVVVLYLRWNFNSWKKCHVLGPKPHLLSGTFPKTSAGKINLIDELHEIYLQYKSEHKYVGVFAARTPKLFILDPQVATEILTQNFKNFHDNESSQWTSPQVEKLRLCSPFVSTGEAWKEKRSELVPALTANRLRAFYATMQMGASKLVQFIATNSNQEPLNVKELANRYTAEFISDFIWGIEAGAFSNDGKPSVILQLANSIISQSLKCVRYYGRTAAWPWLRKFAPVRFFPATCDNFFKKLAADTLQLRLQNALERSDVINHLRQLKEKKSLNDEQIAGHTTTVLIDGFETVAIVISHCLLLLARNPRVQEKLRREILVAGSKMTYDELNELPYLEQCLQETLRIFPPLPTLFKLCTESITLTNNDQTPLNLQPNDAVYISSYSFHHDADYYENPEEFWPERFHAEFGGIRKYQNMGVFMPFGNGPRICPGMKLALANAKVAVVEVLRHFELKCSKRTRKDNQIAKDSFLLTLDGEIELHFSKIIN